MGFSVVPLAPVNLSSVLCIAPVRLSVGFSVVFFGGVFGGVFGCFLVGFFGGFSVGFFGGFSVVVAPPPDSFSFCSLSDLRRWSISISWHSHMASKSRIMS